MKVFMIGTELHTGSKKVGNITPANFRFKSEAWLNANGVTVHTITGKIEHYEVVDGVLALTNIEEQLSDAKDAAKICIASRATSIRKLITGNADQYKVAGYVSKAAAAKSVLDGTADEDEVADIQNEADLRGRGETFLELAGIISANNRRLCTARGSVDGMESAALSGLKLCVTTEQVSELQAQLEIKANAALAVITGA